jgi:signal transduction histidine kinase
MPSSTEPTHAAGSPEAALLDKIEQLSFLGILHERLAGVPDFGSACQALVDLVLVERTVEAVAYVSIDAPRRICRLEALATSAPLRVPASELDLTAPPLAELLQLEKPMLVSDPQVVTWLGFDGLRSKGALLCVATRVRGNATGLLFVQSAEAAEAIEEERRLLAIVAATAAPALDVARNQGREEFLSTLRHDINNPIHVAMGYTEMILDRLKGDGPATLIPLASSVSESLKAVADLVSNYLHMAAIDRGAPWIHHEDLDLGALAEEIVDRHQPSAAERGLVLAYSPANVPARADRRQLGRVITNLIGNALKYTPAPGRIEVVASGDEATAAVSVTDSGYGLTPEDLARLFTKYGRCHRDKGIPGTGLGLFISKAIVEAHGGTIVVESAPGCGSTFTMRVPRRQDSPAGPTRTDSPR